jgi:hypothetical protein
VATNTQEQNKERKRILNYLAEEFKTPPDEIEKAFFVTNKSMALTQVGHRVMSKVFNFHQFKVKGTLLTKHIFGLKHLEYPYYLTEHWLILYNSQDTTLLELYGSADDFLDAYASDID